MTEEAKFPEETEVDHTALEESIQARQEAEEEADPLMELEAAHADLNDRYLRLVAEFDNFRKRVKQERMQTWGRAQAELVGKFLEVLDDLQRVAALDPESATVQSIVDGIDLVERKFLRNLQEAGIEELDPRDAPFDPNVMEAVTMIPTGDDQADELVAEVFQKGYVFQGNLVRPARVGVFKAGAS